MKRKLWAVIMLLILIVLFTVGCNGNTDSSGPKVSDIFVNFNSTAPYTTVTEKLRLPKGVSVSSYDSANDVFVTKQSKTIASSTEITRFGLCSSSEVYIEPKYKGILDINGDHAIVVAAMFENGEEKDYVGVVRFRGKYGECQYSFYPYAIAIDQMSFLDENLMIMLGNKNMTDFSSSGYNYATIYDYTSANGLMEVAKVKNVDNYTRFVYAEGYLAAINYNEVAFYSIDAIDKEGYLEKYYSVNFFTEKTYTTSNCSSEVYYLGNKWFMVSGTYTADSEFDGYDFTRMDETDNYKTYYIEMHSKLVSMLSKNDYDNGTKVAMVSNKYTSKSVRGITDAITTEDKANVASWTSPYVLPIVPTSEIVKSGYSLVYYYYYYYKNEEKTERAWTTSFFVYDTSGNATVASNMAMPAVFVDGIGLQNSDPDFNLPLREVGYHKYEDGSRIKLIDVDADAKKGYSNVFTHNGVIISYQSAIKEGNKLSMGAVRASNGKEIVPFGKYDAISPFFGYYATASIGGEMDSSGKYKAQAFYRISMDGQETSIPDCYVMCNGVYVTRNSESGKFGLKANDGTVLISNKCDMVSTVDCLFKNGKAFNTVVATVENGAGVIYALG